MFYINPENFKGCKSKYRIDLEGLSYKPRDHKDKEKYSILFNDMEDFNYCDWIFDTKENRDEAVKKIDKKVKVNMVTINRIEDMLYNYFVHFHS